MKATLIIVTIKNMCSHYSHLVIYNSIFDRFMLCIYSSQQPFTTACLTIASSSLSSELAPSEIPLPANMDAAYKRTSAHSAFVPAKKAKRDVDPEVSALFSVSSQPGALQEALSVFKEMEVDLKHIESRPSRTAKDHYEFYITSESEPEKVRQAVEKLSSTGASSATILDRNPDTDNPEWFPRRIRELDMFADRVLDAGRDLQSDHPGFTDKTYRERRAYFADIAISYKHGTPIPKVDYTEAEVKTWGLIFNKLVDLYPTHACAEFNEVFPLLRENCDYQPDTIPQLEKISQFLHDSTGFRLRPVAGLLSSRDFLAGLAFRVFHSTQYIRHSSKPLYTPEPDLCHEILGHVPLFANKSFAEFSQEIGLASLGATDEDIQRLATLYWFTVEFGVCRQDGKLKAYGAGLLSSFGELQYCLSDKPDVRDFEPSKTCMQEYPVTEYQPIYFAAESFDSAKQKVREFARQMKKPFTARYNAYTESIELLDNATQMKDLAVSIQSDMNSLVAALDRRT
eukprot:TRINITY_DN10900_c0_g1_i2.p1 TRINITY_DN10900_c0_g1~~TRINITY_DN10900_c0_g1_i2.p1  ORF type:complete len:512 (+),score=104.61 TRINITY_DN10900_c0_g1_i2:1184-2719(+)